MTKLNQRPSPKMKSIHKEELDDAAIAAWKFLGFIVIILWFIFIITRLPSGEPSPQPPGHRNIFDKQQPIRPIK